MMLKPSVKLKERFMSNYLHKYNTDNVHHRAVIVGLINVLNSKIQYENILSDTDTNIIEVPFYYSMGGDERFLQDYFLHWNDCIHPKTADGNYDVIPRGHVTLESSSINTGNMTNRFVRASYIKEVDGQLLTYNSFLNSIPLTLGFKVQIVTDTSLDAFKIQQSLIDTFYKTQVFSVNYKGFRVPCQVGFPEDYGMQKTFEFSYQDDTKISLEFSLEMETYFPVTDITTERFSGNRMNYDGGPNLGMLTSERYATPRFSFLTPNSGERYFSSNTMPISWEHTGPILRVNLYYRVFGETNWRIIIKNLYNSGKFNWNVPFFDHAGREIPFEMTKTFVSSETGRDAKLRSIIDGTGGVQKILITDGGNSYSGADMINVETSGLAMSPLFPEINATVVNGIIEDAKILMPGSGFIPSPLTTIELKIEDSNDNDTYRVLSHPLNFIADYTLNGTELTNIIPNLSTPGVVNSLGLKVGEEISGSGIINGTKIINWSQSTNTIFIDTPTNGSYTNSNIVGESATAMITIQ